MKRVIDHIRESLEKKIRPEIIPKPSLEELRKHQWSDSFEKGMRDRLVMGAIRYETLQDKAIKGNTYKILEAIHHRTDLYASTGNQEYLFDIANFCLIEFVAPTHPAPHLSPTDDGIHVEKNVSQKKST